MITFLEGILENKELSAVTLNVKGVGYAVYISLSSYDQLPDEGTSCRLLIYHHITDSDQKLFGFMSENEREMFRRLLTISGVGPKLALSALSGLSVRDLQQAVSNGDVNAISSISGIGRKTAERMIVELRDVFSSIDALHHFNTDSASTNDNRLHDAALALNALGYSTDASSKMVKNIAKKITTEMTVEDIIRIALTK